MNYPCAIDAAPLIRLAYAVLDYGRHPTLYYDIDSAMAAAGATGRVCEVILNARDDRQDSATPETAEEIAYHVLAGRLEAASDAA